MQLCYVVELYRPCDPCQLEYGLIWLWYVESGWAVNLLVVASSVPTKLGSGWAVNLLVRKNQAKFDPTRFGVSLVWLGLPANFFSLYKAIWPSPPGFGPLYFRPKKIGPNLAQFNFDPTHPSPAYSPESLVIWFKSALCGCTGPLRTSIARQKKNDMLHLIQRKKKKRKRQRDSFEWGEK